MFPAFSTSRLRPVPPKPVPIKVPVKKVVPVPAPVSVVVEPVKPVKKLPDYNAIHYFLSK
jgi:hypothetical protein